MLSMHFTIASAWSPSGSSDHFTVIAVGTLFWLGTGVGGSGLMLYMVTATTAATATAATDLRMTTGTAANERSHASGRSILGLVRARTSAQTSLTGASSGTAASLAENAISSSRSAAHSEQFSM